MAGTSAQPMVDIESLHATVTRLDDTVERLTTNVAGQMPTEDGDYAGYAGPSVRAHIFEHCLQWRLHICIRPVVIHIHELITAKAPY